MRMSHVELRSRGAPIACQYVSDTHAHKPDAPVVERNKMTVPLGRVFGRTVIMRSVKKSEGEP
jgi:hypothetical protein